MHIKYIICHELRITWGYVSAAGFLLLCEWKYVEWKDNLIYKRYLIHYERIMSVEVSNWNKRKTYIF
jgi:hypothetical protein